MAMEIRMRDLDTMIAQLSQKFDTCAELSSDTTTLKVNPYVTRKKHHYLY
jgi:predicted AlkP superfamily phosphohydrolase/phosphomutase